MTRGGKRVGSGVRLEPMPEHFKLDVVSTRLPKAIIARLEQEEEGVGPFIRKLLEHHYKALDEGRKSMGCYPKSIK